MTHELNVEYFDWMCQLVCDRRYCKGSYRRLLDHLHCVYFEYSITMDGNRAADGEDLKYRFARERGYDDALIVSEIGDMPCTVLEMMIALALRCEGDIMEDPEIGDRTGKWFWDMVSSLGLRQMIDRCYDEHYTDRVIKRFLNRRYMRDGRGGLFTVHGCKRDMRRIEIWYQMCMYLDEFDTYK